MTAEQQRLKMTPEQIAYVEQRWHQLYALLMDSVKTAINYLFIVNGGGCVAVLAFLGSDKANEHKALLLIVLVLFFVGLLLVGVLNIQRYRLFTKLERNWVNSTNNYNPDNNNFKKIIADDNTLVMSGKNIVYWGYASFLCLFLAGLFGFLGMLGITICLTS